MQPNYFIVSSIYNDSYCPHGKRVVEHFMRNGGILSLEKRWRVHFLKTMKPAHLPPLWSVDHQQERLDIRQAENRIDKKDYEVANGLDKKEEENANDAQFYHVMDEADLGNADDDELMDEEEAKAR